MEKTLGQVLDEYLTQQLKSGQDISSVYLYMEDWHTPKVVINTKESSYDYTEILYEVVDLKTQADELKKQIKASQDKLRLLEKSKRDVEKAIRLLKGGLG